jgi:hypothetical protein
MNPPSVFPNTRQKKSTFYRSVFVTYWYFKTENLLLLLSDCNPQLIIIGSQTQKASVLSFSIPNYQQVKYNSCASFSSMIKIIMILDLIKKKKVFYIYSYYKNSATPSHWNNLLLEGGSNRCPVFSASKSE